MGELIGFATRWCGTGYASDTLSWKFEYDLLEGDFTGTIREAPAEILTILNLTQYLIRMDMIRQNGK